MLKTKTIEAPKVRKISKKKYKEIMKDLVDLNSMILNSTFDAMTKGNMGKATAYSYLSLGLGLAITIFLEKDVMEILEEVAQNINKQFPNQTMEL